MRYSYQTTHHHPIGTQFIPAPPEQFVVNSSYVNSQGVPISNNLVEIGSSSQNIKKTYIPHHIYNEIPILASETKQYHEPNEQEEEESNSGADEVMLEQYKNLYSLYINEKSKSQHLQREMQSLEIELNQRQAHYESPSNVREVKVERKKKVNIKLLSAILQEKSENIVREIVNRRKSTCLNRLNALFIEAETELKDTLFINHQSSTHTVVVKQ